MKLVKILSIVILVLACAFLTFACSKAKSPVTPATDDSSSITNDLPESLNADVHNRSLLAAYDAVIDPVAKTFTVEPMNRSGDYHFPMSQFYRYALEITDYNWAPDFWADIKLDHPLPGSGIDGFDARVIAILPANPGVRFIYPVLGVGSNNAVVLEPDGYTKLFDNLGGSIPGNTNPFKAYFKDQPYRKWSNTGVTEETQRWQMDIAGFGGPLQFKLVVDVSTNYPTPSAPVVDNAPEPVKIDAMVEPGLIQYGGNADITVTLLDWQGESTIGGVLVEAPDLFNGTVTLSFSAYGPNPNEYVYTGTITNSLFAPEGEYKILVAAWDQVTGIFIYNEFTAFVSYSTDEGNLIWAKRAGGRKGDYGQAITTLSDNSTVVTGHFSESATFGKYELNQTILSSAGGSDIFIARYNNYGTLVWAKRAGGRNEDKGYGITTLSDNSTVVTGIYDGLATFGPGETNETVLTGSYNIFIAKYNPDGTLAWAKCGAGGTNFEYGYAITTLSDNSTVVSGRFSGTAIFGEGEPNETVLVAAGWEDIFIARYNPYGTLAWAKRAGGTSSDKGWGIATLSDNSTVVTGYFSDLATFGPGEPNETVLTSVGSVDIFISRYNPNGTLVCAKCAGGSGSDEGHGITTLSDNSTVLTGYFEYSATFGLGETNQTILTSVGSKDIFIARYNLNGTLAWVKCAGGTSDDLGEAITIISDNYTVVTGSFFGSATFGTDEPNQTVLTAASCAADIFIAQYNPDGSLTCARRAGGEHNEGGSAITSLSDNSTVATGYFSGQATFGPGEPNETVLFSSGSEDIFIARFVHRQHF